MTKFKLHVDSELQGHLAVNEVNIAFVFQVNCPGCFIHGIPIMNQLYQSFSDTVGFVGVSTAFEDFKYNSLENTQLLLTTGETVGETRRYLQQTGTSVYQGLPKFPIAFDAMTSFEELDKKELLDTVYSTSEGGEHWDASLKLEMQNRLEHYYNGLDMIAKTFTLNQLKGTPSFIVFDATFNILHHAFGHTTETILQKIIQDELLSARAM